MRSLQWLDQPRQVDRGGLALDVGIGGQDDLLELRRPQPVHQLTDVELLGTDVFQRRQGSAEDVVQAVEGAGALDRDQVARLLDDAQDRPVSARVGADRTEFGLG